MVFVFFLFLKYLSFYDISFSIILSRSIHIFTKGKISFFCVTNIHTHTHTHTHIYIHTHTPHIFFIHSSLDGHLGCFCILTILSNAALNIGIHISMYISFQISIFVFFK